MAGKSQSDGTDDFGFALMLENLKLTTFEPPFPGADGEWVPRDLFRGKKSFGGFVCECGASWVSAHAQKLFKQQCKTCKKGYLPDVLWQNANPKPGARSVEVSDRLNGHHLTALCEACKRGCCTAPGGIKL